MPVIVKPSPPHTTNSIPQPLEPQSEDTLSEDIDEEILVADGEKKEPLIAQEMSDGVSPIIKGTPTSRGPTYPESNSSRKRRLKKERKLRIQGSR